MVNRKRQDYNDVGWGIDDTNYHRFITQIKPELTSIGWWHKGPKESIYSRFSRSINTENKSKAIYFDVNDRFSGGIKTYTLRIVWLDEGIAKWTLSYDSMESKEKTAITIQNSNSGEWKEKTIKLNDARFKNRGKSGADIVIRSDGRNSAIFHLIELNKL